MKRSYERTPAVVRLYHKQRGRCYLCGTQMQLKYGSANSVTIEHVTPKSLLAGEQAANNHRAACYSCNQAKGSLTASEYRRLVAVGELIPQRTSPYSGKPAALLKISQTEHKAN